MLSPKPWKLEAISRLILSVFICICAGSLLAGACYYGGQQTNRARFYILATVAFAVMGVTLALLQRTWEVDRAVRRIACTFATFYAGLLLAVYAETLAGPAILVPRVGQMIIGMLSVQGAGLVLIAAFLVQQQMTWSGAFGFLNNWKHAMLWGLIVAGIFLPMGMVMQKASDVFLRYLPALHLKPEEQVPVQTLRLASTWVDRVLLGVVTIVLAPVAEETFFRGIIYPTIKQAGFPRLALWITSIGFAAVHKNLMVFVPLMVLAILLTLLYEKFDNLLAPITAHALFNAANFTMLYFQGG
jgi:membrane protease YdiL (CAAX protease family)